MSAAAIAFAPIGLGVAMVRHGLFDGDRWLGPTLVYGVLTVFITAVFAVTVGLTAGTIGGRLGAAVAAAVVAVALAPVRTRVQRLVDRWLYGGLLSQRHPYAGQHRFGRQVRCSSSITNMCSCNRSPAMTATKSPKSTSAWQPASWVCGTVTRFRRRSRSSDRPPAPGS